MLSQDKENQIIELNTQVKVRIGVSKIEGVGVIALTKIRKGERCYCVPLLEKQRWYSLSWGSLGKLFPHVEKLIKDQWPSIINGSHFLSPNYTTWPILYMNHRENPNYDNITDTALQDIAEGEELTEDYKKMDNWELVFPWIVVDFPINDEDKYEKRR